MNKHIVIVGGGAIGCATAYFLTRDPNFTGSVTVIERDPTYKTASSALSASSIRQQFSTPVNIALSSFGFDFIQNAEENLSVGEDRPALSLHEGGYLVLASPERRAALEVIFAIQRGENAPVILLEPEEIQQRFPQILPPRQRQSLDLGDLLWVDPSNAAIQQLQDQRSLLLEPL